MFSSLGKNGINIRAIAQGSSERNISAVIKTPELEKALNVLHESFFGNTKKEINLFIIGTGNVGKKLINQLLKQSGVIEQSQQLKINLSGIMNSRKMIMSQQNILSADWNDMLDKGEKSDVSLFTERMIEMNLRNSVLVDITANSLIPEIYSEALNKSISVVACNKIAASGLYEKYRSLKEMAVAYNAKFLFETNVGAALPIISTINDVIKSGDKIKRIDAVLSGTLNFVFNNYTGKESFASIVKKAQDEGYTEPDPRLDLSGIDVMRKIMILARESGELMEIDDVSCNSFLPESCMKGTVDDFYIELEKNENHFKNIFETAHSTGSKLKFVATLENGKASVGLQHIKEDNEMYHLYGKDNIVLIKTDRYDEQPLVIKGAGAGADVTASGVFADILRTINN
jgi:aspartokinase/homoserine dehydrogenase 1